MRGIGHAAALYQRNEAPGADTHTHTHTHTYSHVYCIYAWVHDACDIPTLDKTARKDLITSSISAGTETASDAALNTSE